MQGWVDGRTTTIHNKLVTERVSTPEVDVNGAPQDRQNRAEAGISWWQTGQIVSLAAGTVTAALWTSA